METSVFTLSQGTFDFTLLEDAGIYGNLTTEVLGIQFIGRLFTTDIENDSATIYSSFTDDGEKEAQPFMGKISNLPGGGVEIRLDTNIKNNEPVSLNAVLDLCIDAGLLQLPASGDIEFTGEFESKVDSDEAIPMTSSRQSDFSVENVATGNPRIMSVSSHRVKGGEEIEVFGQGFSSNLASNKATVQGKKRIETEVLEASPTRLLVQLPITLESGPLIVEIGGKESNEYQLVVIFAPKISLDLSTTVAETNAGLDITFEQPPGEIAFFGADLQPFAGQWVTTGFAVGKKAGVLELSAGGETLTGDMVVRSNDGDILIIDAFEPDGDDPTYVVEIRKSEKILKIYTFDPDYTSEIKVTTTVRFVIQQPVYFVPTGKFGFDVSCISMPERTLIMETSVVVQERREIQR